MRATNGHLADNLRRFCRGLRAAGLPLGPGRIAAALMAAADVGIERRDDLHAALRAVLVGNVTQFGLFDRHFEAYFGPATMPAPRAPSRAADLGAAASAIADGEGGMRRTQVARAASHAEVLRHRDFECMRDDELAALRRLLPAAMRPLRPIVTRRFAPHARGARLDLRRTLRRMLGNGGEALELARRRPVRRPPDLVLLCDISGSMSRYARAFLLFAHALAARQRGLEAFVFGTRLSRISERLGNPDADAALAAVAADVADWDGGTRIARCLRRFNRDWGRRLLARGAVVVLLCDGLERAADDGLGLETARLQRSCRQLVWLNPMLRYAGFEPLANGIRQMLPHVDRFLPAHNLDSLVALCRVLADTRARPAAVHCA